MIDRPAQTALVGAWRLISWENRAADGQVTYPMGSDAIGYLLYTASGRFSVTISRRGRAGFAAGDLLSGTTEEQARAVEGFVAYAGRYSFMATVSSIMWSCRCSPTGSGPTSSGRSN
jgi:Lipocalin-like domain